MTENKYGYWISGNQKFHNKYEALVYASQHKTTVTYWYHDEAFTNLDKSLLGKISLDQLYRERAQRLRDDYDYLILYYSGGADSHNILKIFLDNNIKLDEVCVKWPKSLTNGKLYKADPLENSPNNIWSEWDYAILPTLKWLKANRPNIRITIKDYIADTSSQDIDNYFEQRADSGFKIGAYKELAVSNTETELITRNKRVANISGVDKPLLYVENNRLYMFFSDVAMIMCSRSIDNPNGGECFYWAPDMPIIPYEQAYQLLLYYRANVEARKFLYEPAGNTEHVSKEIKNQYQQDIAKQVIYSNWDNRFQALKGMNPVGLDLYPWFTKLPELESQRQRLADNIAQRTKLIDTNLMTYSGILDNTKIYVPKVAITKFHYVGDLDVT